MTDDPKPARDAAIEAWHAQPFGTEPFDCMLAAVDTAVAQAVSKERERCALICESRITPGTGSAAILMGAATAIRALDTPEAG